MLLQNISCDHMTAAVQSVQKRTNRKGEPLWQQNVGRWPFGDLGRRRNDWFGSDAFGTKVTEIESPETTAFPMYCTWETFGLPGMKVIWKYSLEYAGQLGFDTLADQQRFTGIWERVIGKVPVFESSE